ncbi:MAG: choice-of-anchor Q domain-containing protein [Kiritimatiellia bacterium]
MSCIWQKIIPELVIILTCGIIMAANSLQAADFYAAKNGQMPSAPYSTWATAAAHIQDAVDKAGTNDTVWVGAGRYTVPPNFTNYIGTNVVFIDKPLVLRSSNGVPATTIIDGGGSARGAAFFYRQTTSNLFVIDGFTITNCYATNMGGGLLFNGDNLCRWTGVVINCIITHNTVAWGTNNGSFRDTIGARGGGIGRYNWNVLGGCGLVITNCVIRNNTALKGPGAADIGVGGGIYLTGYGYPVVANCLIENNAAGDGAGIHNYMAATLYERCVIRNNTASAGGGGFYLSAGATLINCLVYNNAAATYGGGIYNLYAPPPSIINCTITSNTAPAVYGAGIRVRFASQGAGLRVCNSIIYSNAYNADLLSDIYTNFFFTNTCIFSTNDLVAEACDGNFTNSPRFVDFAGEDFHLAPGSPCVNAGINQDWMTNAVDLNGERRIRYGTVDVGACEMILDSSIYRFH